MLITKVGSTRRGTARPTGLANGVLKVIARLWQRTVSGSKQISGPLGVVAYIVACFMRVFNTTKKRSTLKEFQRYWEYEYYGVLCGIASRVCNGVRIMIRNR